MCSRHFLRGLTLCVLSAATCPAPAASHRDWTIVPLGSFPLKAGEQDIQIARPFDRFGTIPEPIVLAALFDPSQALEAPAELRFWQGQRELPIWTVQRVGQLYVLGLALLGPITNDEAGRVLRLRVSVKNAPAGLTLMASGAPDLKLAPDAALGPLEEVVRQLDRGAAREYLNATAGVAGGQLQMAVADFERLARGPDETVARFARTALRRIRFAEAEAWADASFGTHYRLGLYAQQCGQFRAARLHLEAALQALRPGEPAPADRYISEAWYRLGEMMERCGEPIAQVAEVMEKAGRAAKVAPHVWNVWVTLLLSNEYEETHDGQKTTVRVQMTAEQIERIKREWHWVEQMVYGASGGHFQLDTRYVEIPDTSVVPYGLNAGWLYGPLDAFVPVRGSVDCVMSFHPRGPSVTGGADCGPNGAALTDIGTWCGWEVYLHEWNHQFDWTVRTDEAGDGYPITHHSDSCGHQPIPSMGYGHRASMHYYVTPAMYRRIEPADPDTGEGYIRNWQVGAPAAIRGAATPDPGQPPAHQADKLTPAVAASMARRLIASEDNFLDLKAIFSAQGATMPDSCMAPATAWVHCPRRQEVRLWLGHNDGMAVWVNEELVHRGDYYAIAKFGDQNWPNMVATSALLLEGWNKIDVAVESWPAPRDKGYGFSVRICDFENRPVKGLSVADARTEVPSQPPNDPLRPAAGKFYRWEEVRDDFYRRLPRLTGRDLATRGGLPETFDVVGSIGATQGFVALGTGQEQNGQTRGGVTLRAVPQTWDRAKDSDTRLNNVMDWNREAVAVYPLASGEPARHYLLLRPEAIDAYLTCLREAPAARKLYVDRPVADRVLGYVQVGDTEDDDGVRVLIVAEVCLPTPVPFDEEDLLAPLAE